MLALDPDEQNVQGARSFAAEVLATWRVSTRIAECVPLVVSELVTNAIRHSPERPTDFKIQLRIAYRPGVLAIGVSDPHPGTPVLRSAGPAESHGRGLRLVEAYCDEWTVLRTADGGKQVCAFWALPDPSSPVGRDTATPLAD